MILRPAAAVVQGRWPAEPTLVDQFAGVVHLRPSVRIVHQRLVRVHLACQQLLHPVQLLDAEDLLKVDRPPGDRVLQTVQHARCFVQGVKKKLLEVRFGLVDSDLRKSPRTSALEDAPGTYSE